MAGDVAAMMNESLDGWCRAMSLRFTKATADEVAVEWTVGPQHLQAYGIVHGGVHCGVVETIASVGAAVWAMQHGQAVVGLENHTSFLRATRQGERLRAVARPLTRGRTTQVWEASVTSADGKVVAQGQVRLLCLQPGAAVAGGVPSARIGP